MATMSPTPTVEAPVAPTFNLPTMREAGSWTVEPKTQTVAGQLQSVIATDSPLMQQARARALQAQNANGMLNSSMATGAADSAMYDTALKIATPDAATYADAGKFNAGESNKFSLANNQNVYDAAKSTYNVQANEWGANQDFGRTTARDATAAGTAATAASTLAGVTTARDTAAAAAAAAAAERQVAATTARDTAAVEAARATASALSAADQGAVTQKFNLSQQEANQNRLYTARSDFTISMNNLLTNPNLSPDAKKEAIASLQTNYNFIIKESATSLGWKPEDWLIDGGFTGGATAPGATVNSAGQPVDATGQPVGATAPAVYTNPYQTYPQQSAEADRQIG